MRPLATERALVILALAAGACAAPAATRRDPAALTSRTGARAARELTADEQARHAVSRLTFGARPGQVDRVRRAGVDRWIAEQLRPERIPDSAAARVRAAFPLLGRSAAELYRDAPPPARLLARARRTQGTGVGAARARGDSGAAADRLPVLPVDSVALAAARRRANRVVAELAAAKVARAVASERELDEVMVDFWENHFNVFAGKGPLARYLLADFERDAIRPHALGRFRDLLGAVAKSPAMLYYLDNWQSVSDRGAGGGLRAAAPVAPGPNRRRPARRPRGLNENYARELLELHTLGVDGGYTQRDVREVARALTGWSMRPPALGGGFVFRRAAHDAGPKVVLGRSLPAGRGVEDGEAVLDLLAAHPSTARFIAAKLARRFVSDTPPAALVERAARVFEQTRGDIRETVRAIVTSPEFFSRAAYRAKVKSPFEVVVSTLRALGAEPDTTPRTAQLVARLGQPIFGHQAPNGYPETGAAWMGAGAILARVNFGLAAGGGRVPGVSLARWASRGGLAGRPRAEQVSAVIVTLLGGAASGDTRRVLESGEHPLLPGGQPRPSFGRSSLGGLAEVVGLALGSPEFQRR